MKATIASVQQQSVGDWECIVVDDGSTDDTGEVIASLAEHDNRIRLVRQKNSGAPTARNTGMGVAQGEWVVYLDSDDTIESTALEKITATVEEKPNTVFGILNHRRKKVLYNSENAVVQELPAVNAHTGEVTLQDIYHWKVRTTSSGLFHHRRVVKEGIGWDSSTPRFQDWDFLMTLGVRYPSGFVHIPDVLVHYTERYGTGSMCDTATYADWADAFEHIYQKHAADPLMEGQRWYPNRVEKYKRLQQGYEAGKAPAPAERYFQ